MTDDRLDDLIIILDLARFGEIVAHVAAAFAQIREIDEPDFEGQEMRDLAISAWRHVVFMYDRERFKVSVAKDLETISTEPLAPQDGPQHRPEFGFFEPPL